MVNANNMNVSMYLCLYVTMVKPIIMYVSIILCLYVTMVKPINMYVYI